MKAPAPSWPSHGCYQTNRTFAVNISDVIPPMRTSDSSSSHRLRRCFDLNKCGEVRGKAGSIIFFLLPRGPTRYAGQAASAGEQQKKHVGWKNQRLPILRPQLNLRAISRSETLSIPASPALRMSVSSLIYPPSYSQGPHDPVKVAARILAQADRQTRKQGQTLAFLGQARRRTRTITDIDRSRSGDGGEGMSCSK